jgi:hypothetical protein
MRGQGTRLRLVFALICLAALAAVLAGAGGGGRLDLAGPGDPDAAGQSPAPAQINAPKTPANAYFSALHQAQLVDSSGPSLAWASVGARPITGGYAPANVSPPLSGRGTAIAVASDANHPQTAYLGTAEGGVWKTTDDGQHWSAKFDNEPTLAIGAVAVDPTNADNVYVGTGEANWALQGGQVLLGDGIYHSTNGGDTWTRAAIPFASGYMGGGCGVESLVVDPANTSIVLAAVFCPGTTNATATAIIRSTDSGASWTGVGPAVGNNADETPMFTVDPNNAATWYATIAATGGGNGIWKSTDSGATWTQKKAVVPGAHTSDWTAPRAVVAVAPSDSQRLYALVSPTYACPPSNQGSCLDCPAGSCGNPVADPQLLTSPDGGTTWTEYTNEDATNNKTLADYVCGTGSSSQCNPNLTMAVSPSDPATVYIGTIDLFRFTDSAGQTSCVYYCQVPAPIHGDEHALVFGSQGRLWVGNDGGVYRFDQESDVDTSATNLNASLPTIQVYRLAVGTDGKVLIATQDQGCDVYDPQTHVWSELGWEPGGPVGCGDSVSAVISAVHPGVMYAALQYNGWIVRTPASPDDPGGPYDTDILDPPSSQEPFMAPLVEEPGTGSLLTGGGGQVWRLDNPDSIPGWSGTWTAISPTFGWWAGAIAVANAPSPTQTIYVGSSAYANTSQMAIEYTHDGGSTWTASNGCCGFAPVTDIEVDPSIPSHAYATTSSWPPQAPRDGLSQGGASSQVYETTDGGTTWHSITGNLPAAPYNAIAVDWGFSKQTIYVATDVGVFWSEDDGVIWHATSSGMPNVSVEDLQIQTVNNVKSLYAATFGRGVYSAPTIATVLQTLTVSKSGAGSGRVTSGDGNIDCGSTCAYDYASSPTVTLTAAPAAGSTFTGWSGGGCSGTGSCQVTLNAAKSVTATFGVAVVDHTLTVSNQGSGSGTITSSPSGISCGATCSHSFVSGTPVTLTAAPDTGSTFVGWSGDCSGTGATCQLPMEADHSATATFVQNPVLTVEDSGSGSVTSDPTGIDCGSTCSQSFAYGTVVTLTATASSGFEFAGWSGDCSGTSTCQVTMSQARSVIAEFGPFVGPPSAECRVPKVVGKKVVAAMTAIDNANCSVGTIRKKKSRKRKGTVIGQSPAAGTQKDIGARVNLTVSKGK